ncbi:Aldo/keto reductase [Melia azedarach]|uniref:Aldo/keto reductase n=1 Tax=Melia azedarach TaxID=155640 RepID=A0ACC1Y8P2_MELAZ|nr:Aldo/keto reductase [Melia azedarach]
MYGAEWINYALKLFVESLPENSFLPSHPRFMAGNLHRNKNIYFRIENLPKKHKRTTACSTGSGMGSRTRACCCTHSCNKKSPDSATLSERNFCCCTHSP